MSAASIRPDRSRHPNCRKSRRSAVFPAALPRRLPTRGGARRVGLAGGASDMPTSLIAISSRVVPSKQPSLREPWRPRPPCRSPRLRSDRQRWRAARPRRDIAAVAFRQERDVRPVRKLGRRVRDAHRRTCHPEFFDFPHSRAAPDGQRQRSGTDRRPKGWRDGGPKPSGESKRDRHPAESK